MNIEEKVENLEKRVSQNEKNIRYINKKTNIIKDGLNNVESTFIDLKNNLDRIDSKNNQDHYYDIDISKGSLSFKNPSLEFLLATVLLILTGFLFKVLLP